MGRFSLLKLPLRGLLSAASSSSPDAAASGLFAAMRQRSVAHNNLFLLPGSFLSSSWRFTRSFSTFQPSRLYPKQRYKTPEDAAFWGIIGLNVGMLIAASSPNSYTQHLINRHFVTSVDAMYDGRFHTILTSIFTNTSAVHCAMNLSLLAFFRRVPNPLSAVQLVKLYVVGSTVGNVSHLAYYWYDAKGYRYGPEFASNTPAMLGCSGGVSTILLYKAFFAPRAVQRLLFLPVPLILAQLLYINVHVKEANFQDGPPSKIGGAVFGLLMAWSHAAAKRRAQALKAAAAAVQP